MSHRDILKKLPYLYFFWLSREHTRENIWGRHMLCRIFRPIDWYHSLVPKKLFSGVLQDLGPFLESPFWPVTRKRLIFEIWFRFWAAIFFNFLSDGLFTFFGGGGGGWGFLKTFPIFLNLTRSEESLFWKKNGC